MSLSIILQQMGVIIILVAIGFGLQKKGTIDALSGESHAVVRQFANLEITEHQLE